jgi:hypothetical protein
MKKYLKLLSMAMLAFSTVFFSACGDDDEGGAKEIPAALIKSITLMWTMVADVTYLGIYV